jgi:carboxyl-terminal processing protease
MVTLATRHIGIGLAGALMALMVACGGDDDGGDDMGDPPDYEPGVFDDHALFAARCESPRADRGDMPGSFEDEKMWLRSWVNDLYLWYSEVPDEDPAQHETPLDYFEVLKTPETTPSGKPKDQFHFTYDTDAWEAL